jgi:hypothetical protein
MRRWLPPASNVDGITWPPVVTGPHAALAALVHYLDAAQWLPREQIERLQRMQLSRLAEHLAEQSPHFRVRLREAELKPAASPAACRSCPRSRGAGCSVRASISSAAKCRRGTSRSPREKRPDRQANPWS